MIFILTSRSPRYSGETGLVLAELLSKLPE